MGLLFKDQWKILICSKHTVVLSCAIFLARFYFVFFNPFENVHRFNFHFFILLTIVCLLLGHLQMASRKNIHLLLFLFRFPVQLFEILFLKWLVFLIFFLILIVFLSFPSVIEFFFQEEKRFDHLGMVVANALRLSFWGGTIYSIGLLTGSMVVTYGRCFFLGIIFALLYLVLHFLLFQFESTHEISLWYQLSLFNTNIIHLQHLVFLLLHTLVALLGSHFLLNRFEEEQRGWVL